MALWFKKNPAKSSDALGKDKFDPASLKIPAHPDNGFIREINGKTCLWVTNYQEGQLAQRYEGVAGVHKNQPPRIMGSEGSKEFMSSSSSLGLFVELNERQQASLEKRRAALVKEANSLKEGQLFGYRQ